MVEVRVTNEGPGIAADEVPRLFTRFARTRSARASTIPGIGLGLYICRGLVEALGGTLWVDSIPGDRTTFHFTLDFAVAAKTASGPARTLSPARDRSRGDAAGRAMAPAIARSLN